MRKICLFAITLVLFTLASPSTTVAQEHPLGLQWGTSVGEHYAYNYRVVGHINLNRRIVIEVTALREIPANPDALDFEITLSSGIAFYTNGSSLSWFDQPPFRVLPIGNWSYVSWAYEDYYGCLRNYKTINTTTSWGFSHGGSEYQQKEVFDKSTGVIESYYFEHRDETGALISLLELAPPSDASIILIIGGAVFFVFVIVWLNRRRKLNN
jgi:hypothetical protein